MVRQQMMIQMLLVTVLTCVLFLWPAAINGQAASSGDLRLNGTDSSGRLEFYFVGVWGTVCDDGFGSSEAAVACRQLGFSDYSDYGRVGDSQYPQGVFNIWLTGLSCSGSEARLENCNHDPLFGPVNLDCRHNQDVALSCSGRIIPTTIPAPGSTGSARLVARDDQTSPSLTAGRLEVYYNGQWGTVCDDGFGSSEAEVICRQLGFSGYITFGTVGGFGIGFEPASSSTPIWLDSFSCSIADSSLSDCSIYEGIGVHNCNHNEDIALFCLGDGALMLSPGTSSGRLEIYYNGEWGTVCDDAFDQTDADVACRQLGYTSASRYGNVGDLGYSQGSFSTQIWLDNLQCTSFDLMLSTCAHSGFGNEDCDHFEDVAVSCTTEGVGLSGGAIAGIIVGILAPCCCIGICVIVICVAIGSGTFSSKSTYRGNRSFVPTTTATTRSDQVPKPYPTAPSATAPPPTAGTTQPFQPQPTALAQEPPPPYPGILNTYPVQPQPGAQYPAYPHPYAPPTVGSAPPPQLYPTETPPTTVASAPPPQPSAYQQQQGVEMQQYPTSAQPAPYPPTMPDQATYPSDPAAAAYPSTPPAPYPPTVDEDTKQGYPPPTN